MGGPAYTLITASFQGIHISVPDFPVQAFLIEGGSSFQFAPHTIHTVSPVPAVPFYPCCSRYWFLHHGRLLSKWSGCIFLWPEHPGRGCIDMTPCPALQKIISAIEGQNLIFHWLPLFLIGDHKTGIPCFPFFRIHLIQIPLPSVQAASASLLWLSFSGSVSNGGL